MARPWPKRSKWPYLAKNGRKSYSVGYYDHEKRETTRTFPSVRHARVWMDAYVAAERRGPDSLRRFLLDLDAKEANQAEESRSLGEVLELYLAVNAHPRNEGGLAPSTYERYEWTIGRHLLGRPRRGPQGATVAPPRYAVAVASVPVARFNTPQSPRYGLGARNQEVWGLRWASLAGEFAWVMEVLSSGELTEWGKTEHSTQRRTALPGILREDLAEWRAALRRAGHPARELDFIIPGDLNGPGHGALDSRTGASHFSENQARSWGARFFTPAVEKVAQRPELFPILGATPYSLRRGGISLRLRAEDPQTVASECGTSLKMLSDHYAFAIEDLRRHGPRPADVEWRAARTAQANRRSREQALLAAAEHRGMQHRRNLFAWFSERRSLSRVLATTQRSIRPGAPTQVM